MIELCREAHQSEPEFIEDDNMFIVRFKAQFAVGVISTDDTEEGLTDRQKEILKIMSKQNFCSSKYILANLSFSITDRTLRNDLSELAAKNLVSKKGKGPKTVWFKNRK